MDDLQSPRKSPLEYVRVLRRRKAWFVVPFLATLAAGAAVALLLPASYTSSATLAISAPRVSPDMARSLVPLDQEERARALQQQLMSSATLRKVALSAHLAPGEPSEAMLGALRSRIDVTTAKPVGPVDPEKFIGAFLVSYTDPSPRTAALVTNRLAEIFVAENAKTREARAEGTTSFLDAQLQASKERLAALDAKLRQEKQRYMGSLPEQTSANLQLVGGLRQQLESTAVTLRGEQDHLTMIEREIGQAEQEGQQALAGVAPQAGPNPIDRVRTLERALADARATYTARHPEVQRLESELAAAKADAARERQMPAPDRLALLRTSPAYRQLTADREQSRLRVQQYQAMQTQLAAQIAAYQARVDAAPMVEQQLAALQRDFDLEKKHYEDLTGKTQTAALAEDLERKSGSEQFKILFPASVPSSPTSPNRARLLLLSFGAALVAGAALTVLREYLDPTVHDARALQQAIPFPVLGEIPRIDRAA